MAETMDFLEPIDQLKLQGINRWWYDRGLGRVQFSIQLPKMFYFTDYRYTDQQIIAYDSNQITLLKWIGDKGFSN